VVYGHPASNPVSELSPARPTLPLGRSLSHVESLVGDCREAWGLKAVVLRFGDLAGADERLRAGDANPPRDRFVSRLARVANKARPGARFKVPAKIEPDGSYRPRVIDLLHVADAAAAVVDTLCRMGMDGLPPVANVASGTGTGLHRVLEHVVARSGHEIELVPVPLSPGIPLELVADTTRFVGWTRWSPRRSHIESIVASAMAFEASR